MTYSTWIVQNDEVLDVEGDCIRSGTAIQVSAVRVLFRGKVDITQALTDEELARFERKLGDAFINEEDMVP